MSRIYTTENLSGKNPSWYWDKSSVFHDAKITAVNKINLNNDYTNPKPVRNCCEIELTLVNTHLLKFYNSNIIQGEFIEGNWWLCDTLREENNKFILDITVCDNKGNENIISIRFDYAEVL